MTWLFIIIDRKTLEESVEPKECERAFNKKFMWTLLVRVFFSPSIFRKISSSKRKIMSDFSSVFQIWLKTGGFEHFWRNSLFVIQKKRNRPPRDKMKRI